MTRRAKWLWGGSLAAVAVLGGIFYAGSRYSHKFEPYIRQQVQAYLSERFASEVEIGRLDIAIPRVPPLRMLFSEGKGVIARVTGTNIVLRHRGRRDIPPLLSMGEFVFEVDVGRLFDPHKRVALVEVKRLKLVIPPKGQRPALAAPGDPPAANATPAASAPEPDRLTMERVILTDSELVILPRHAGRAPLEFALHRVVLGSLEASKAMSFEAQLTNPKPIGLVNSTGSFGPFDAGTPGDTPLAGRYTFSQADLSIFAAIAGRLESKGTFQGTISSIDAKGEASVPDFRLKKVGRAVPLYTSFEARVDGTDGDTILKPVRARLGTSNFTTAGAVLKHEGARRRSIVLDVSVPDGELLDFLKLTVKTQPPMSGRIAITARVHVPPLQGKVSEKLRLDGQFTVRQGQFRSEVVQDKLDALSRRAQGQPKNLTIEDVFSQLASQFHMEDETLSLPSLTFRLPGAAVDLAGRYELGEDQLDFAGTIKLDAKASQTQTGWKRWALKPVDPILAKNGAGTFLKVKITGTSKDPDWKVSR